MARPPQRVGAVTAVNRADVSAALDQHGRHLAQALATRPPQRVGAVLAIHRADVSAALDQCGRHLAQALAARPPQRVVKDDLLALRPKPIA